MFFVTPLRCKFNGTLRQDSDIPSKLKRQLVDAVALQRRAEEETHECLEDIRRSTAYYQEKVSALEIALTEAREAPHLGGLCVLLSRSLYLFSTTLQELTELGFERVQHDASAEIVLSDCSSSTESDDDM